ncbi:lysozyme inhibitor LprI family protein [Methylocystis sp.]|uniref:lysozyme inhibitor LprI family protein n=1 Tax=Methylocystis sp. TaxID=1911079 RepID=UPI003DA3AD6A
MTKRTTADQILEWKERRGRSRVGAEILYKIDALTEARDRISDDSEIADFIPIRIATIIEVYVRETLREVVDANQIYLDRAEPLLRNAKLDFLVAKHLHGQRISMGDVVAHSVSVSDLEHVISIYETLLPGYRKALPEIFEEWIEDRDYEEKKPIIDRVESVFADVKRVFEVRHIVTHEMPGEQPYSTSDIGRFLTSSRDFLSATDWFLTSHLWGDVPQTQLEMNLSADESLKIETAAMERLLEELKPDKTTNELVQKSQDAWMDYANAEADLRASIVTGGSMYPLIWANRKAELVRSRIKDLRAWIAEQETCGDT